MYNRTCNEDDKNPVTAMTRKVDRIKEFHINVSDTGLTLGSRFNI